MLDAQLAAIAEIREGANYQMIQLLAEDTMLSGLIDLGLVEGQF